MFDVKSERTMFMKKHALGFGVLVAACGTYNLVPAKADVTLTVEQRSLGKATNGL